MPLKIKFIKDDDEGILPYCEEEDAEKFYFQQILTARFSWGSNIIWADDIRPYKACRRAKADVTVHVQSKALKESNRTTGSSCRQLVTSLSSSRTFLRIGELNCSMRSLPPCHALPSCPTGHDG